MAAPRALRLTSPVSHSHVHLPGRASAREHDAAAGGGAFGEEADRRHAFALLLDPRAGGDDLDVVGELAVAPVGGAAIRGCAHRG